MLGQTVGGPEQIGEGNRGVVYRGHRHTAVVIVGDGDGDHGATLRVRTRHGRLS
jgi:hypothetical protein